MCAKINGTLHKKKLILILSFYIKILFLNKLLVLVVNLQKIVMIVKKFAYTPYPVFPVNILH